MIIIKLGFDLNVIFEFVRQERFQKRQSRKYIKRNSSRLKKMNTRRFSKLIFRECL